MAPASEALFTAKVWRAALEKFGAVTHLTVALWADQRIVFGPVHPTPLFDVLAEKGYEPGIIAECARRCLAQVNDRPAVVVAPSYGLGVVGTSLALEGTVVGAAVAGYALVDFAGFAAIEQLARQSGVPPQRLWEIARRTPPIPERRLLVDGELLQILGDAILRESRRARLEAIADELTAESAAKDEFLAMLGHELRNPLAAVLNSSELLRRANSVPAESLRHVELIDRQARQLSRIADDLLDVSRIRSRKRVLDRAPLDLREVAHTAVAALHASRRDDFHPITVSVPSESLVVDGDAARLAQVLDNLLDNAIKYTPSGGKIALRLRREGDHAIVHVQDDGAGIEPRLLPRIFDVFTQGKSALDRPRGGLGLGLALVKALVEAHGGSVEAKSAGPGRGSDFLVGLPLAEQPVAPRAETVPATIEPLHIVLVEDNRDAREALRELLSFDGHTVDVAADGLAGLRAIQEHQPQVAIVDIGLPLLDGYELAQRVRADPALDEVRLLALTGYGQPGDLVRAKEAGFDGHVVKPVDSDRLARALASVGPGNGPVR